MEQNNETSKWVIFGTELKEKIFFPLKHPEFVLYFIFIPVIVSLGSTIISNIIIQKHDNSYKDVLSILLSVGVYFIAILSSSAVDLILMKEEESKKAFSILGIGSIFLGLVIFSLLILVENAVFGFIVASLGVSLSLFIWWIANATNKKLTDDEIDVYQDIGGTDEQIQLTELSGDISNYNK